MNNKIINNKIINNKIINNKINSIIKRKYDETLFDEFIEKNNFKNKRSKNNNNEWISGTSVANYLNGEPLLDWLNLYYYDKLQQKINNTNNISNISNTFNKNPLITNGLIFEKKIYEDLKKKFKSDFVQVFDTQYSNPEEYDNKYKQTLKYINDKVPIIAQAVLIDDKIKFRGVADLLIRHDYINKIFNRPVNIDNKKLYYVFDIKWTNMTLCVDEKTIRNEGRFKAYKAQLYIYNYILGKMQNHLQNYAFIIAKSWKIDSVHNFQHGYSCYDLVGVIDYLDRDNIIIKKTYDAILWLKKLKKYGSDYDPLKPHIKEMCVNASNQNDSNWKYVKKELLKTTKDITSIYQLSQSDRDLLFDKNIKSWDDNRCNSTELKLKGKKAIIVDKILEINRQNLIKILPKNIKDIKDNRENWKEKYTTDMYIDFETISDNFKVLENMNIYNSMNETPIIFMIGLGYEIDEKFIYKVFKIDKLNKNEEKKILLEFFNYVKNICKDNNPRFFHWSHAEKTLFTKATNTFDYDFNIDNISWIDLYDIFVNEPIVVNGALNYKLKEIGNAMYKNNLIETSYESDENGINAMTEGIDYYNNIDNIDNISNINNIDKINNIIKYNEKDCKILWEIVKYLRSYR
jgi:hypothetical protein